MAHPFPLFEQIWTCAWRINRIKRLSEFGTLPQNAEFNIFVQR